ncbi:NACHTdomain protein [Phlyctema vagabunda]|uniref:NACHTdomain protein n=1 Tax=Phlyctema vagabunda TaxID=108571 RepID=A0ABR4PNN0_9HELO
MVASDHVETIEKLAKILQRIVASLERYSNYETLFKNNLNTQRAIGALYSDLIDLCTRVVKFHSRPSITGVFVSFDKEFQQVSENISHHSTEVDWAANAANIDEAKNARGIENAARSSQTRGEVQKWLSPANVQDDLHRYQRDCMAGSCDWALEIPQVQSFFNSSTSEILRIGGAPGSGKSTLITFLIDYITSNITKDVLYFFCKGTDDKKSRPFQVLRTLISQLLAKDESLYPWFETLHQQSGQEKAESYSTLHSSLLLALRSTSKQCIFVTVDALDECQEAQDLILSLTTAVTESKASVKILISCREDPELLDSFSHSMSEVKISQDKVQGLVSEYINQRVSKCKHISRTALGLEVHQRVTEAAAGLWLSARLMMDEIQRLPSPLSIARQLQNIPIGIIQLYQQIFATMEKSLSPLQLRLSQQVFLWIDMADFVEVGRSSLDRDLLNLVFEAENDGEAVFDAIDLARQLCSPLIELCGNEDEEIEVEFVHHTTAQFVRMCAIEKTLQVPQILKPQRLKSLYRGNTSAWFFQSSPQSNLILQRLRAAPQRTYNGRYFEMAYGLWNAFFLEELPASLDAEEIMAASALCDKLTTFLISGRCLKWIESAIIINYGFGYCKLYDNVLRALDSAQIGTSSQIPSFRAYSLAREQFFADYAYVIASTGRRDHRYEDHPLVPEGFNSRRVALQLLSLGIKWSHLVEMSQLFIQRSDIDGHIEGEAEEECR